MQDTIRHNILEAGRNRDIRHKLIALMLVLSIVIVPGVFWWLKLTGITMAGEAFCGMAEHVHDEECTQKVLVCTLDEGETYVLATQENTTKESQELIAITTEAESTTAELVSSEQEDLSEAESTAEEAAAAEETTAQELTTEEVTEAPSVTSQPHVHTDECYEITYTCGLDDHIHIDTCYSNSTADVESASDWEKTMLGIEKTGDYNLDLVSVAKSQLDYAESTDNFKLDESGVRRGYTRYGEWFGNPYSKWSAMFVSFCLYYSGISDEMAPYNSGTQTMLDSWNSLGIYQTADSLTPVSGDVVFLGNEEKCSYVGIITEVSDSAVKLIYGGDTVVKEIEVGFDSGEILGYGSIVNIVKNSISEEDIARIDRVVALIEELPTTDEVTELFAEKQQTLSEEKFNEFYMDFVLRVKTVYCYYEDLGAEYAKFVPNAQKLLDLNPLWQNSDLALEEVSESTTVYQVNAYSYSVTTLFYGGTPKDIIGKDMAFTYWDAVVVEENENGDLYVSQYITESVAKNTLEAATASGFVLLTYGVSLDVSVGDGVEVDFDYTTTSGYNSSGYGTVSFGVLAEEKPDVDNSEKLTIVEGADTRDWIEVNLYNYSSNINEPYLSNSKYPGFQQDGGTKSIAAIGRYNMNFGNNITEDLDTLINNITSSAADDDINSTVNGINTSLYGIMSSSLQDGYPALADGTSLAYLFSNGTYAAKMNSQSINGLFQYDPITGHYYYNSRNNHAQFNSDDDTFTLYEQVITSNFIMYPFGNFLPFNDIVEESSQTTEIDRAWFLEIAANALYKYNNGYGDEYSTLNTVLKTFVSLMDAKYGTGAWSYEEAIDEYFTLSGIEFSQGDDYLSNVYSIDYDEETNFFFGMDMHLDFIQPKDGLTGQDGQQEMVFNFTGDDDVWVYVDGKLFLELTGIHRHVGGKIDFVRGVVEYYDLDTETGDVSNTPVRTVTFAEILGSTDGLNEVGTFEDYSTHTMNFYYMERGAGSGICRMEFNFPVIQKNSISVSKHLSSDVEIETLGNPDFKFQILKAGTENELFIPANTEYTIYDENGNNIGTTTTDANGIVSIKAGQTATFGNIDENSGQYYVREILNTSSYEQFGKITIDGASTTLDTFTDVVVGSDSFKGVESAVKDISDGSTSFLFNNNLDADKLGSIEISKHLLEGGTESFEFELNLDGEPLPIGAQYTVVDSDGNEQLKTVTEAGIIELNAAEKAVISNIIAGSSFTLKEISGEIDYTAFYSGDGVTVSDSTAIGTVRSATPVYIRVVNTQAAGYIEIPVNKILYSADGAEHEFTFKLEEVEDETGDTLVAGGIYYESAITVVDKASKNLVITFPYANITGSVQDFYFKVSEKVPDDDFNTVYDSDHFVVQVRVTKNSDDKTLTSEIIGVWDKNASQVSADSILFENVNVRSLSISKRIEGIEAPNEEFSFKIFLWNADSSRVNGTFPVSGTANATTVTFTDGVGEIILKAGQTARIENLPYGAEWSIGETSVDGYYQTYRVDSGDLTVGGVTVGDLKENHSVEFINTAGYILPETGDNATLIYALGVAMFTLAPLLYGLKLKRKKVNVER